MDPVDFTLSGTGITIVIGPNGAGKTSLLRMMHCLSPDANRRVEKVSARAGRRLGAKSGARGFAGLSGVRSVRRRAAKIGLGAGVDPATRCFVPRRALRVADGRAPREIEDILASAMADGTRLVMSTHGTGQALRLERAGNVDAILVHSRKVEEKFLAEGFGTHRREIMYNDFVLIGPSDDPAGIASADTAVAALTMIAGKQAPFVSRGDDSGTHKKELGLWQAAGQNVEGFDGWYRAVGAGMGNALNTTPGMNAYIMSDRASWLNFKNKGAPGVFFAGDPVLLNQYAFIPVNPATHPHVKSELAGAMENWLVSERAKSLINAYTIDGEGLFVFNARPK